MVERFVKTPGFYSELLAKATSELFVANPTRSEYKFNFYTHILGYLRNIFFVFHINLFVICIFIV